MELTFLFVTFRHTIRLCNDPVGGGTAPVTFANVNENEKEDKDSDNDDKDAA